MRHEDPELLARCAELTEVGAEAYLGASAKIADILVPNDPVDLPTWAGENMIIPTGVSDRAGPYEMNAPQKAIARFWQDPLVRQVDYLKVARAGATLLVAAGMTYFSGHLGYDTLFFERNEAGAQDFHDKKLYQILMASPSLAAMVRPDSKAGIQDAWSDRILKNGASIQLRSGNKPIKSIKGLFVVIDEGGDGVYTKGVEGNIVTTVKGRLQEFCAPVLFVCGTPTDIASCIASEYSRSDKRHWFMPCPHCASCPDKSDWIAFEPDVRPGRRDRDTGVGIRYVRNERGVVEDAWYACKCGNHIEETSKIDMIEAGEFRATDIGEPGHVGCYTWAAHSTDPQKTWRHIGAEHHASLRDEQTLQAYTNLTLAQPYDPNPPAIVDTSKLQENVLELPDGIDCPEDTVFLVAAGDNNAGNRDDPRFPPRGEYTVLAVRTNGRLHVVSHTIISHLERQSGGETRRIGIDPFSEDYADAVYGILDRDYVAADGRLLRVRKTLVDCGWQTELAYKFCIQPASRDRGILPIKGDGTERANRRVPLLPVGGALRRSKKSGRFYLYVGTRDAKDECARRLAIPAPAPGSVTFAANLPDTYYESLLAQRFVEVKPGIKTWVDVGDNPGEAWDTFQYAYAGRELIIMKNRRLRAEADDIDPEVGEAARLARTNAESSFAQAVDQPTEEAPAEPARDPLPTSAAKPESGDKVTASGIRYRVVERKTTRSEIDERAAARIERIRNRKVKSGVGW